MRKFNFLIDTLLIVDRLTKTAQFILIKIDYDISKLSRLYVEVIIRLHSVPITIVFDRNPRFTSKFWKSLQKSWVLSLTLVLFFICRLTVSHSVSFRSYKTCFALVP